MSARGGRAVAGAADWPNPPPLKWKLFSFEGRKECLSSSSISSSSSLSVSSEGSAAKFGRCPEIGPEMRQMKTTATTDKKAPRKQGCWKREGKRHSFSLRTRKTQTKVLRDTRMLRMISSCFETPPEQYRLFTELLLTTAYHVMPLLQ